MLVHIQYNHDKGENDEEKDNVNLQLDIYLKFSLLNTNFNPGLQCFNSFTHSDAMVFFNEQYIVTEKRNLCWKN